MKTYAKLEDGALRIMWCVPNISNPTDGQAEEYAACPLVQGAVGDAVALTTTTNFNYC